MKNIFNAWKNKVLRNTTRGKKRKTSAHRVMQSKGRGIGLSQKMGSAVMMPINADRVAPSWIVAGLCSEILFAIRRDC